MLRVLKIFRTERGDVFRPGDEPKPDVFSKGKPATKDTKAAPGELEVLLKGGFLEEVPDAPPAPPIKRPKPSASDQA